MAQTREDDDRSGRDARWIVVVVARSGGIAGVRRQWKAEPTGAEAKKLMLLVSRCPWDEAPRTARGADRFSWSITARWSDDDRRDEEEHTARLGDDQVTGPWRTLVDEVREWKPARADRR